MLRFTDNKLNWKPSSEINISEQRRPGKTCMTGKVINMADGQYRQGVFSPPEKVDHSGEEEPQKVQEGYWADDDTVHLHQFIPSSQSCSDDFHTVSDSSAQTQVIEYDQYWIKPTSKKLQKF